MSTKCYPYRRLKSREFTSSGTFIVPSEEIFITGCGGGGGGTSGSGNGGAGGGGSVSCFRLPISALKNESVTVTIGAGGAAGTNGNHAGAGGTTSFGNYINLLGGDGGSWFSPTPVGGYGGGIVGRGERGGGYNASTNIGNDGGAPTEYGLLIPGGGGGGYCEGKLSPSGHSYSAGGRIPYFKLVPGGAASNYSGGGGSSLLGQGAPGVNSSNTVGNTPSSGYGGGGSGANGSGNGGAGKSGYIKIEWWEYQDVPDIKKYPSKVLKSRTFNSSGNFISPVDEVFISAVAGGGGGDSSQSLTGGGGAAIHKFPVWLSINENVTVTVGAGGVPAPRGGRGGTTSFGNHISLEGGKEYGGGPFDSSGGVGNQTCRGVLINGAGKGTPFNYVRYHATAGSSFFGGGAANTGGGGPANTAGYSGKLIVEWYEYQ
jgi:hypothetical protein